MQQETCQQTVVHNLILKKDILQEKMMNNQGKYKTKVLSLFLHKSRDTLTWTFTIFYTEIITCKQAGEPPENRQSTPFTCPVLR